MRQKQEFGHQILTRYPVVPTLGWGEVGDRGPRAPVPPGTHGRGGKRSRSDKRGLMDNHKSSMLRSGECLAKGETLRI